MFFKFYFLFERLKMTSVSKVPNSKLMTTTTLNWDISYIHGDFIGNKLYESASKKIRFEQKHTNKILKEFDTRINQNTPKSLRKQYKQYCDFGTEIVCCCTFKIHQHFVFYREKICHEFSLMLLFLILHIHNCLITDINFFFSLYFFCTLHTTNVL